jgi:outer membrane receptor protein involved in Fe transport
MKSTWLAPDAENVRRSVHNSIRRWCRRLHALPALLAVAVLAAPDDGRAQPTQPTQPTQNAPQNETVVEAPARDPQVPREDLTASASVITSDRTPRSGENLPQLMAELPGVTVTRYGSYGSLSSLSVRGSSANQVAVYADGVPLASAVTGAVDLGLLPMTGSQRIELYRGASPLSFGSSAMGGVISLTSEAPLRSGLSLHSGLGSFATRMGGAEAALVDRRFTLVGRFDLFYSRADFRYRSDNRTLFDPSDDRTLRRTNNQMEQEDASVRATAELPGRRQLLLAIAGFQRDQGLPARGTESSISASLQRRRLYTSGTYQSYDDLGAEGQLRATTYCLLGEQRFDDQQKEIAYVPTRSRDRSLAVGTTVVASKAVVPDLVLSALVDGRHEGYFPHDELQQDGRRQGRREFGAAGLGATASLPALALTVVTSVRGEAAHDVVSAGGLITQGAPATAPASYFLPIARLGVVQSPHRKLRLRANVGRYARLPTLFERYGNGGFIIGNHELGPERGWNADLGAALALEGTPGALLLDGGLFAAQSRDLIHFEQRGPFSSYQNVARSHTAGSELALAGRLGRFAHLFAQATVLRTRDRSGISGQHGKVLPLQPLWRAYGRPELRDVLLPGGASFGLYADAEVTGPRYQDPANLVRQPARLVVGGGGFLAYQPWALRLVGSAYNLTDVQTPDALYFPLPGRSFFLTLQYAYSASPEETIR